MLNGYEFLVFGSGMLLSAAWGYLVGRRDNNVKDELSLRRYVLNMPYFVKKKFRRLKREVQARDIYVKVLEKSWSYHRKRSMELYNELKKIKCN